MSGKLRCAPRGFTLIELLVVVSIIALLLAILLPSLAKARAQAKALLCQTRMRELSNGTFVYYTEFGRFPPSLSNFAGSGANWNGGMDWLGVGDGPGSSGGLTWGEPNDPQTGNPKGLAGAPRFGKLWPYVKDEKLFRCTEEKTGGVPGTLLGGEGNGKFSFTVFSNLGVADPNQIPVIDIVLAGGTRGSGAKTIKRAKRNLANIPVFVEEHPDGIGLKGSHIEGNFNFGTDYVVARHAPHSTRLARINGQLKQIRQGSSHVGFVDGHVEGVRVCYGLGETDVKPTSAGGQGLEGIPYTAAGLLYHFGIKYEPAAVIP